MKTQKAWFVVAVTGLLLLPTGARAQSATTGAIAGVARDATGAVLPGVTVEAASDALIEKVRTVVTDGEGQYKIVELRPGTYSVTFTLAGFNTVKREGIELTTGFTAAVNADMRVGSLEETITVSGASPVVDTQNVRTQTVLSRTVVDTLPTNRSMQGFATLTVGATAVGAGIIAANDVGGNKMDSYGGVNYHGNTALDGRMMYDGMRFNAGFSSGGGPSKHYFVNQQDVEEVVLELSGLAAEAETSGVHLNMVPKSGGNTFKGAFFTTGANGAFQGENLTDSLKARGLTTVSEVKRIYDVGGGFGGPFRQDTLWFYTAHRWWGAQEYAAGNFYNKTHGTPVYTPDPERPGYTDTFNQDNSIRLTWQAAAKHKFTGSYSKQRNCSCHLFVDDGTRAPEAAVDYTFFGVSLTQGTWSFPVTSRLLIQAGGTYLRNVTSPQRQPEVGPNDIATVELSRGFTYNSNLGGLGPAATADVADYGQHNERFSVSYVTGSHAFKVGAFTQRSWQKIDRAYVHNDVYYNLRNGIPVSLVQWASPNSIDDRMTNLGLYAQDQWTLARLTLNLGIRYDYFNGLVPEQTRPGGRFVPEYRFAKIENVPNYKDISPRMGAAYDLFGNGKTAVKGSVGRYVGSQGAALTDSLNPANAIVNSVSRTWNDVNGNFRPDCDLKNFGANSECGTIDNAAFGTLRVVRNFADDALRGWGNREYNWQTDLSVQHELRSNMSVNVGWFYSHFTNFTVNDNLATTPADFDRFCITAPKDARLAGGGGYQVCDLADVKPAKFGQVNQLVTQASNFGNQTRTYSGADVVFKWRFGQGGVFGGGTSTGRTGNHCAVVDGPIQFCDVVSPFLTQVKLNGSYPLPWWGLQASATFQSLPGIPILATYVPTNAEIAPSLGRNLAACGTAAVCNAVFSNIPLGSSFLAVNLIEPNHTYEDRLTQVDVRLAKTFRFGRTRIQGMFDIYNALNSSAILLVNPRFGPLWRRPAAVQGARLFKLGGQLDF